jgi:hypothetical protein
MIVRIPTLFVTMLITLAACVSDTASTSSGEPTSSSSGSSGSMGSSSGSMGSSSGNMGSSSGNMGSSSGSMGSSSSGTNGTQDAAPDAPSRLCNPNANFAVSNPVTELNQGVRQYGARITPSGLELYLTREERAGYSQVHRYTRTTLQSLWGNDTTEEKFTYPVGITTLTSDVGYLTFAGDNTAYFSVRGSDGNWLLRVASRSVGEPWGFPAFVFSLASAGTNETPFLNAAGTALYFMSTRATSGTTLFHSVAGPAGLNTPTQLMLSVGTTADTGVTLSQSVPMVSQDGKTMYFAGLLSGGGRYIYKSTGGGTSFGNTMKDPTLNTGENNELTWLSPDTCEAYLTVDGMIRKAKKPQ